ncbi:hypothetical protein TRIATDRAFT_254650 [Trichoderma atroviride IMI 206040]|uniref:Uncharacterized protein n=1 Tax=Hypocrea atroviridis (strain ATCC 20476 / IMI 206040) TaxID=452589 RepID=G9NH69_HYPAI|nr:uncharacterized protein TRIATDRAFT_254650 [Trichoderma atroviride IMI 206040]EHK49964.1 hypothetical protein TRIATDRAFT_254650 [Trichoderma atroviride IMI 206040]
MMETTWSDATSETSTASNNTRLYQLASITDPVARCISTYPTLHVSIVKAGHWR